MATVKVSATAKGKVQKVEMAGGIALAVFSSARRDFFVFSGLGVARGI